MRVIDKIGHWANEQPDRLALISPEAALTYRGLAQAIDSLAHYLGALHLDKSEPIAVALDQPLKLLPACFALLRLGYSVSPVPQAALPDLPSHGINVSVS